MTHRCRKCNESMWGRVYDQQCNLCCYKELETLRAKLVKAGRLAEQAAKTISYANYMEPVFYLGLESTLKKYMER